MLAQRGITLSYEAIRYWCKKFGQAFANAIRQQRYRPGDRWHGEEVFLKIGGKPLYTKASCLSVCCQAGVCSYRAALGVVGSAKGTFPFRAAPVGARRPQAPL